MKAKGVLRRIAASILVLAIIAGTLFDYKLGLLDEVDDIRRDSDAGLAFSFIGRDKPRILHEDIEDVFTTDAITERKTTFHTSLVRIANEEKEATRHVVPLNIANSTVISWKGVNGMNSIIAQSWQRSLFCDKINKTRSVSTDPNVPIIANLTVNCRDLFQKSIAGTGNFITLIYGIRLAAYAYGNVDVYFTCTDAEETKKDLILPWVTGWFPARPMHRPISKPVSINGACGKFAHLPLAYMHKEMQNDLRKMAIKLVGVPWPSHPSAQFAKEFQLSNDEIRNEGPLFSSSEYELDDAVLHFRCGDLMDSTHGGFGFMKFSGYTRHISSEAKSIGILTQPFDDATQTRKVDMAQHKRDRCRIVVHSLVEYIQERYPNARVRIRNDVGETIALTFARMIMANQSVAGISSFSAIASVVTFGKGYIRFPDYTKGPNQWLVRPSIEKVTDNVVLFHEPIKISVTAMKQIWENQGKRGVLEWFRNDTAA
jgi:hypothetical protein